MSDLDLLKKALSSLKDTFDVLLKAGPKKEYPEWSLSREPSSEEAAKASNSMKEHGFNAREASVHAGIEKHSPQAKFTPFSDSWLKNAKEHAANHYAKMESKRLSEAKPEENPLVSTHHVTQQLASQHGNNYAEALKAYLSKPENMSLSLENKKKAVAQFKTDFHNSGKANLNQQAQQIRAHEAGALADQAANKEYAVRNLLSPGSVPDVDFSSEVRAQVPVKEKISSENPLSRADVMNYLNNNAGQQIRRTVHKKLANEGQLSGGESIKDHEDLVADGMMRALHTFNPNKSANFPAHASDTVANLIRRRKEKEGSWIPQSLKQEMTRDQDLKGQEEQDSGKKIGISDNASTALSALGDEAGEDAVKSGSTASTPDVRQAQKSRKWLAEHSDEYLRNISEKAKKARDTANKIKQSLSPEIQNRIKAIDSERSIHSPQKNEHFETPDHLYDSHTPYGYSYGDLVDSLRDDYEKKGGVNPAGQIDVKKLKSILPQLSSDDMADAPDDFVRLLHSHAPNELINHKHFSQLSPEIQEELKTKTEKK